MKLDKIVVKPEDIVPDISFYGESYYDEEQLKNIEDVKSIALEAIYKLGVVANSSKNLNEISIKDIHDASAKAIKDIKEFLGDFE